MTLSRVTSWSSEPSNARDPLRHCIRCGGNRTPDDLNCAACTWPFRLEGWPLTTRRVRRLTADTGCVNAKQENPDLNKLEEWHRAGWLRFERAEVMLEEIKGAARVAKARAIKPQPLLFRLGSTGLGDENFVLAGESLDRAMLAAILFPTTATLEKNHQRDIEHLQAHVHTGGDAFVTLDNDFLDTRRGRLQQIGIWPFRPDEMLKHLRAGYGELPPAAM